MLNAWAERARRGRRADPSVSGSPDTPPEPRSECSRNETPKPALGVKKSPPRHIFFFFFFFFLQDRSLVVGSCGFLGMAFVVFVSRW